MHYFGAIPIRLIGQRGVHMRQLIETMKMATFYAKYSSRPLALPSLAESIAHVWSCLVSITTYNSSFILYYNLNVMSISCNYVVVCCSSSQTEQFPLMFILRANSTHTQDTSNSNWSCSHVWIKVCGYDIVAVLYSLFRSYMLIPIALVKGPCSRNVKRRLSKQHVLLNAICSWCC